MLLLTSPLSLCAVQMQACYKLQYIGVMATGYNVIDLEAAK
jgi:lactate dehydrogenase-like 2-hydroxyacid dehydrogenase